MSHLLIRLRFVLRPLADSILFLTLTRLVVVFIFVNFSFALFTPPLGDYHRVRALGQVERSFLWCLWQGLTACQSHSVKGYCSRSGAGGAVLLSGRSVER